MLQLSRQEIKNMRFRKITSFKGQHSFWRELGGYGRIAVADQSIIDREGGFYQPQHQDEGLLLVDFHTLVENEYKMVKSQAPESLADIYGLPVVDKLGDKYTIVLVKEEHEWFMRYFG